MIQNTYRANFTRIFRTVLIYAPVLCALSFNKLSAAPGGNGNGLGLGNTTVSNLNITPIITSITVSNGQLFASGVVSAIVNGNPVFTGFTGSR